MFNPTPSLPPGFRFHPTDEELIVHYLRNRVASTPCAVSIIAEVDIYKFNPWELPGKALFGEREWYFFSPRDRKYPNGVRPNRSAASGYWKATGTDKPIGSTGENVGVKKALVFYQGRPPKGVKTNWIMHEYRLAEAHAATNTYRPIILRDTSMRLDEWVLCRIYKKNTSSETAEQEESSVLENASISGVLSIPQQENEPRMPKTCSISDFLEDYSAISHLFDNLPGMAEAENGPAMSAKLQPMISYSSSTTTSSNGNDINDLIQQQSQTGSPALIAGNYLKRQGPAADEENAQPSKKRNEPCSFTTMASPFDGTQYHMMNQSLLNQQLLLNSHLGLH